MFPHMSVDGVFFNLGYWTFTLWSWQIAHFFGDNSGYIKWTRRFAHHISRLNDAWLSHTHLLTSDDSRWSSNSLWMLPYSILRMFHVPSISEEANTCAGGWRISKWVADCSQVSKEGTTIIHGIQGGGGHK